MFQVNKHVNGFFIQANNGTNLNRLISFGDVKKYYDYDCRECYAQYRGWVFYPARSDELLKFKSYEDAQSFIEDVLYPIAIMKKLIND